MNDKHLNISDSEWRVMQSLWDTPNITMKEIAASLADTGWGYTTVRTLVNRLAEKGAVAADKSASNNFRYYPLVLETDCKKKEVNRFVQRVFNGSAGMLISALTKDSNLTEKERLELQHIIEKLDEVQNMEGDGEV